MTIWMLIPVVIIWRVGAFFTQSEPLTQLLGIMGSAFLIIGFHALIYRKRPSFYFFLYCCAMAWHWGAFPIADAELMYTGIVSFYLTGSILIGPFLTAFTYSFLGREVFGKDRFLILLPVVVGLVFLVLSLFDKSNLQPFYITEVIFTNLYALYCYYLFVRTYLQNRNQLHMVPGIVLIIRSIVIGNIPYLLATFIPVFDFGFGVEPYSIFFLLQGIGFSIAIKKMKTTRFSSNP